MEPQKVVQSVEEATGKYVAQINELVATHESRVQAVRDAESRVEAAKAELQPIESAIQALKGPFNDAMFDEDQQRLKEIQSERQRLVKARTKAENAITKASKALDKVSFDEDQAEIELSYRVAEISHELSKYRNVAYDIGQIVTQAQMSVPSSINGRPVRSDHSFVPPPTPEEVARRKEQEAFDQQQRELQRQLKEDHSKKYRAQQDEGTGYFDHVGDWIWGRRKDREDAATW